MTEGRGSECVAGWRGNVTRCQHLCQFLNRKELARLLHRIKSEIAIK